MGSHSSTQIRSVIDSVVGDGTVIARSDGRSHSIFPVAISTVEGDSLQTWVIQEEAVSTIEIGLGYAVSTLFICDALCRSDSPAATHVALDPHQATRFGGVGLQLLEDAGVAGMVEHRSEESQAGLPKLLTEGARFDFAFVDGNHRFDGVFVDLVYLGRLVKPGGVVFLDDYQLPGVARAAAFFTKNLDWALEEVSAADGLHQWAVLRTRTEPDTRPFEYFVDF